MSIDIEEIIKATADLNAYCKRTGKDTIQLTIGMHDGYLKALEQQQAEIKARDEVINFLLSFAPNSDVSNVLKNQDPKFYYTLTYDGDIKILNKLNKIKELLNKGEDDESMVR